MNMLAKVTRGQEEWRPVVGHEGYYEVSNMGNVRRIKRARGQTVNRPLVGWPSTSGYPSVTMYKETVRTIRRVHQLFG